MTPGPAVLSEQDQRRLLRRGRALETVTLGWKVIGILVLVPAAVAAGSVAVAGFGVDSLIEIGASTVVLWELAGGHGDRQRTALRLIGAAFGLLAVYLTATSVWALATHHVAAPSPAGIGWTGATAVVMLMLASGKHRTGTRLGNPVLTAEARVTIIDAALAGAVLTGLALNAALDRWWADPAAALLLLAYAAKEARHLLTEHRVPPPGPAGRP